MQEEGSADAADQASEHHVPRRIAVMRHGTAEPAGRTDSERELADRGHDDSQEAGGWLAGHGFRPVGTWQSVAAGGGFDLEPSLSEALYGAGPETALDLLREAPDDVTAVIVIGHNPTMASLASLIDDGDGDPAVTSEMLAGYPTSAVALFEYDGPWSDLTEAGARLVAYHVGRG